MQRKRRAPRQIKISTKYKLPEDADIDYKNINLLQKYIDGRGKIVARRLSGLSGKQQRQLTAAVKKARLMALLTTGSAKK